MKPGTATLLGILVVIILGGVFYLFVHKAAQPAPAASVALTPGQAATSTAGGTAAGGDVTHATQTVTAPSGLAFSYASPYGLATSFTQVAALAVIPPCDQSFDYCVFRTQPPVANSNFESAGVAVTKRSDLTASSTCLTTPPSGYAGLHATTTPQTGYATSVFMPVGGGAAGSYASGAVYRLWYGTTCYQFETRVAEAQYANYPAGTKTLFTATARANVIRELKGILASVRINGGTRVVFPGA